MTQTQLAHTHTQGEGRQAGRHSKAFGRREHDACRMNRPFGTMHDCDLPTFMMRTGPNISTRTRRPSNIGNERRRERETERETERERQRDREIAAVLHHH